MQTRSQITRKPAPVVRKKPTVSKPPATPVVQQTPNVTVRTEQSVVTFKINYDRDYSDDGIPWYSCPYQKQATFTSHKAALEFIENHGGDRECRMVYTPVGVPTVTYEEVDSHA